MHDLRFGVPVNLGRHGIEKIIEVELDEQERAMLEKSVELIRNTMSALRL